MRGGRVHVVGAGLAGLSAAVSLTRNGVETEVYELARQAGGRCRSFRDPTLDRWIDNGNHLVLSGNRAVFAYLGWIGSTDGLTGPATAVFPFVDLASGERWEVRPGTGKLPWWILSKARRIPGSRPREYLGAVRLARCRQDSTVADCLGRGVLYERFWEPLTVAALNANPEEAAAPLLWSVLRETFARGEAACRPRFARVSLGDTFVRPAVELLAGKGTPIHHHRRLQAMGFGDDRVTELRFAGGEIAAVGERDFVVLAVPPKTAGALVPGLDVPEGSRAIINAHFRMEGSAERSGLVGVVGGLAQWVFVRGDVASVTVSAADALVGREARALAEDLWREVGRILDCGGSPLPPWRVVIEKRATFAQIPANMGRRPRPQTPWRNLLLAGDWTATGLPATIEGSLGSGMTAAAAIRHRMATT
jgi:squalene-associated FAD-dependent desaturase